MNSMLSKTVTAADAKERFEAILAEVVEGQRSVVVERDGAPEAIIVPFAEFQEFAAAREAERRARVWATLERVRERVQRQNPDLTSAEADEIAERASRETLAAVAARYGGVRSGDQ